MFCNHGKVFRLNVEGSIVEDDDPFCQVGELAIVDQNVFCTDSAVTNAALMYGGQARAG